MHDTPTTTRTTTASIEPREFGVGGRITLSVMSDDYVDVILGALAATQSDGLTVETDRISTWVTGAEQDIARYFSGLVAAAARGGHHVVATVMLSRGCPGEVTCERPERPPVFADAAVQLAPTGVEAVAQWALYPLDDQGTPERTADHMRDIYAAIEDAKASGTYVGSDHYVTRLAGDVAAILQTITATWAAVGRTVAHVTTHATISVNSPSVALRAEDGR